MYLSLHNDEGIELDVGRHYLGDVHFKMNEPRFQESGYTLVNITPIMSAEFRCDCWAAMIGISYEPDSEPFVTIPLEEGRMLQRGEKLGIRPGQLVLSVTDIAPGGRRLPERCPVGAPYAAPE